MSDRVLRIQHVSSNHIGGNYFISNPCCVINNGDREGECRNRKKNEIKKNLPKINNILLVKKSSKGQFKQYFHLVEITGQEMKVTFTYTWN